MRTFKYTYIPEKKHLAVVFDIDGTTVNHTMDARYLPMGDEKALDEKLAKMANAMVLEENLIIDKDLKQDTIKNAETVLSISEEEVITK
jgi:hypothetical protein